MFCYLLVTVKLGSFLLVQISKYWRPKSAEGLIHLFVCWTDLCGSEVGDWNQAESTVSVVLLYCPLTVVKPPFETVWVSDARGFPVLFVIELSFSADSDLRLHSRITYSLFAWVQLDCWVKCFYSQVFTQNTVVICKQPITNEENLTAKLVCVALF